MYNFSEYAWAPGSFIHSKGGGRNVRSFQPFSNFQDYQNFKSVKLHPGERIKRENATPFYLSIYLSIYIYISLFVSLFLNSLFVMSPCSWIVSVLPYSSLSFALSASLCLSPSLSPLSLPLCLPLSPSSLSFSPCLPLCHYLLVFHSLYFILSRFKRKMFKEKCVRKQFYGQMFKETC